MRRPGLRDVNVVFPYQRLAELAADGFIGSVTDINLSMLGAIKKLRALVTDVAPAIAQQARQEGADLLFIVPLCPACHQAMGVLARAVERCGVPTVSSSNAWDITALVKPPRTGFLNFPLGNSVGRPREAAEQRDVCRAILRLAERSDQPGIIAGLPQAWPEPDWMDAIAAQYREEAGILRSQRSSEFENGEHYAVAEVSALSAMV